MRMRRKPWARPELAACPFCIDKPEEKKGNWNKAFKNDNPIRLELGCGKGGFISQLAPHNKDINYIAVDIKSEMLGLAKRKLEKEYENINSEPDNILIFAQNIEQIDNVFSDNDVIDRIYINFCNPWPRGKHHKRRLTYPIKLNKYKSFLKNDGQIWFKTDDDGLFEDSLQYFKDCGYEIKFITRDLHNSDFTENIITEHENMFTELGLKIKFLIAEKN